MADPQRAHEPTMEEILASIRRIISDDGEAQNAAAYTEDAEPEGAEAASQDDIDALMADAAAEAAQETADEPEGDEEDVFELTDEMAESEGGETSEAFDALLEDFDGPGNDNAEEADELETGDIRFQDRVEEVEEEEPRPDPDRAETAREAPVGALLSAEAQSAASAAFGALASTMLSHSGGARTLEQIVEDLLRPLLKAWLDENLPPLVERLVRQEIERVARQAR